MTATAKTCSKCGEVKALEEFHKRAEAKDGRRGVCKTCDHARLLAAQRKYSKQHKDRKDESFKAWYWRNRDTQIERVKEYTNEHSSELKEKRHAAYHAEPEVYRQRSSNYSKANRGKKNAYEREYVRRKPEVRVSRDAASKRATTKAIAGLNDSYVKATFVACGMARKRSEVPTELIALKREQLAIKRMARELKKAATKPTGENE